MKNQFRKLTKAQQETIDVEYHQMNPHEFDEQMSEAKTHVVEFDTVASPNGSEFEV